MNTKKESKKITAVLIAAIIVLVGLSATIIICLCVSQSQSREEVSNLGGVVFDNNASHYEETVEDKSGGETGIKIPGYPDITVPSDSDSIPITLLNPEGNPCNFKFTLELEETGETLYTTDYVKPGDAISGVTLDTKLKEGSYTLLINISTVSVDTGAEMNGAQVKTKLDVV